MSGASGEAWVAERAAEVVEEVVGREPHALLLYGSRIAGYGGPGSDYDALAVVEGYRGRIRYIYRGLPGSGERVSILVVDRGWFEADAERAFLGEFVAGRLLSIYRPVLNPGYIEDFEIRYKKRVILEEVSYLQREFCEVADDLTIPLKYVLLARLKRRMAIYPHVKYSYVNTYYGPRGAENMAWALSRLRMAAEELEAEGWLRLEGEDIVPLRRVRARIPPSLTFICRGVKSYAAHGLSAKVPVTVVAWEFVSKIRREFRRPEAPEELREPKLLLRLKTTHLLTEKLGIADVVRRVFGPDARVRRRRSAGAFSNVQIAEVETGEGVRTVAIKTYGGLTALKWAIVQLWLLDVLRFSITPVRRLVNEYMGLTRLSRAGVEHIEPVRLLALDWRGRRLITEYKEGVRLSDYIVAGGAEAVDAVRRYAEALARLHSQGCTLGDTKPQNAIVLRDGRIAIVDLEQWGRGSRAWDAALALHYMFKLRLRPRMLEDVVRAFIEGYLEGGGRPEDLRAAAAIRYVRPFAVLTNPYVLLRIRRSLTRAVQA